MEIERKFTVKTLPENLGQYQSHMISQAYLNENPVVRIRRQDDEYYMTYKGKGLMVREEYNLPLNKDAYEHLLAKADGTVISKTRYVIPIVPRFNESAAPAGFAFPVSLNVELDVFEGTFEGTIIAEVEFPDEESANAYIPEEWFYEDVTTDRRYHNSNMAYGRN